MRFSIYEQRSTISGTLRSGITITMLSGLGFHFLRTLTEDVYSRFMGLEAKISLDVYCFSILNLPLQKLDECHTKYSV